MVVKPASNLHILLNQHHRCQPCRLSSKLKLERPQRVKVTRFLQEIQRYQEQLKIVYKQEDYVTLTAGEGFYIFTVSLGQKSS